MLPLGASEQAHAELTAALGLDAPLHVQLGRFIRGAVVGDFGDSFWQRVPALSLVIDRIPQTLYLAGVALLIAVPTAVALGTWAALRPGTVADRIITIFSLGGVSIVNFWLGLMLVWLFAVNLGWFETAGFGGFGFSGLNNVILPAVTLAYRPIGRVAQFARSALLEEYGKPYVKMARAKGLSESRVFLHTAKNAAIPVVTLGGDEMIQLAQGTVVVETVFAWPGLGLLVVQAIENRDLALVEASVLILAGIVIVGNLLIDLVYTYLNPKIRYA